MKTKTKTMGTIAKIVIVTASVLALSGCAPKPEKLQDTLPISLNLNLNQQKAPTKFPKNPEELQAGDWAYAVTAKKYRQSYFPANADVQIKYLVAHATTIIVEGKKKDTVEYANYFTENMGATANVVQLIDERKAANTVSIMFVKG
ncbi:MAG: hypothetical protein LBQ18_06120, partial [Campylobacteraceae bacterium]|nr:hypothetical protein [Campylobacteraceae bacterium]